MREGKISIMVFDKKIGMGEFGTVLLKFGGLNYSLSWKEWKFEHLPIIQFKFHPIPSNFIHTPNKHNIE